MHDREKVITGLTECIHLYEYPDDWGTAGCVVCPYRPNGKGICDTTIPIQLLKDALELLKEEETVVRCKDCKYYRYYGPDSYISSECTLKFTDEPIPTWFCAGGERR